MKMKKYFSLVVLAAAALATSCSTEDTVSGAPQDSNGTMDMTLTALIGAPQTRVGIIRDGSSASLYWHENDAICVLTRNETAGTTKSEQFTTTAATGSETADFSGKINIGSQAVCAVYPYDKKHALSTDGTTLTYNLPSTYEYNTVESSIFSTLTSDRVNHADMPMFGTVSDGKVAFKHLGGMLVIRVDKMPITAGTLTVTSDMQLSGKFTCALSTDDGTDAEVGGVAGEIIDDTADKTVQITTTTGTDDNKTVTFTFRGATEGTPGVFYLPMATGYYTNFQVTLSNGSDYDQTVSYGSQYISRATVSAVSLVAYVKVDGHWFVDLGLPSKVLWATTNIGATLPTDYGTYYAWGETTPQSSETVPEGTKTYSDASYKFAADNLSPYYCSSKYSFDDGGLTTLEDEDDAAYVNWGTSCHMPTAEELKELRSESNTSWSYKYHELTNSNGEIINGFKITSRTNGNSIFLPYTGCMQKGELALSDSYDLNFIYRANKLYDYGDGYNVLVYAIIVNGACNLEVSSWDRSNGVPVRAVSHPQSSTSVENNTLEDTSIGSLDTNWE